MPLSVICSVRLRKDSIAVYTVSLCVSIRCSTLIRHLLPLSLGQSSPDRLLYWLLTLPVPLAEFVDASKHLANDKVCAVCTESVRVRRIGTKHLTQYHQLSAVDHKIMKIFFNCQKILYGIKEKIN